MQVKFDTEIEHKRVDARKIVRTSTLAHMAMMRDFRCLDDKKKYTEYAEVTRVITDSHNKTKLVIMMTMIIES